MGRLLFVYLFRCMKLLLPFFWLFFGIWFTSLRMSNIDHSESVYIIHFRWFWGQILYQFCDKFHLCPSKLIDYLSWKWLRDLTKTFRIHSILYSFFLQSHPPNIFSMVFFFTFIRYNLLVFSCKICSRWKEILGLFVKTFLFGRWKM